MAEGTVARPESGSRLSQYDDAVCMTEWANNGSFHACSHNDDLGIRLRI